MIEGDEGNSFVMTFAEYEREIIGARVKDAYDKLIQDGKWTGGMVIFGYRPGRPPACPSESACTRSRGPVPGLALSGARRRAGG
jgi:hypothetical protein